jgi:hypothetical protein
MRGVALLCELNIIADDARNAAVPTRQQTRHVFNKTFAQKRAERV